MSEKHLHNLDLYIVLVNHLQKTKKEYTNLKKQYIFQSKPDKDSFNMT